MKQLIFTLATFTYFLSPVSEEGALTFRMEGRDNRGEKDGTFCANPAPQDQAPHHPHGK